ncbi:DUF502 domain-containing protein [Legionella impletisoli]|uniref:Membrane protein n=1 Tax=Legionella impletisoli TaxID=343510 RepID=A0A917JSB5_9GAMM|nr:DUF502 domain-containing protein [Legionella impletisoli]GGI81419.1 membrane protein [Legionella impletisoli]
MKSKSIRSYLLAGLVVWLPILATIVILRFIIDILDQTMALLPDAYQPEALFGIHLPGLGVLLSLILLLLTGILATNFFGQRLVSWSESILERIPLVRSIYNASKQVIQAIFATNSEAFRKVILVEYPRKGLWSLAFQTGITSSEIKRHTGDEMVSIFIPTTPNPTSGFLMMVPRSDVIELSMTIDEALKFIISLGVMQPLSPAAFDLKEQQISK